MFHIRLLFHRLRERIARYPVETTIFCLALFLRLGVLVLLFWRFGKEFYIDAGTNDTEGYLNLGQSIAEGRGFQMHGIASALRTPMYPLFISLFYSAHLPIWFIPIVQNVIAAASAVFLYRIGRIFFSARVGAIAAIIFAIEPYSFILPNIIMTEALFIFFLIVSIFLFGRWYIQGDSRGMPALTGILLGLAILTRPLPFFLPVIFIIFILFKWFRARPIETVKSIAVFILAFGAVLAPWSIRNYRAFGTFQLTNVKDTAVLYLRILPMAEAAERGIDYSAAISIVEDSLPILIPNFDQMKFEHTFEYNKLLAHEAKPKIIRNMPAIFRHILGAILPSGLFVTGYHDYFNFFWPGWDQNGDPDLSLLLREHKFEDFFKTLLHSNIFQMTLLVGSFLWVCAYLIIIGGCIAGWRFRKDLRLHLLFFCILSGFFILLAVAPPMNVRYRLMSYPFLFPLVAFGVDRFIVGRENHKINLPR